MDADCGKVFRIAAVGTNAAGPGEV